MPLFLLANWRWLIPTAASAILGVMLLFTKLELANLRAAHATALAQAIAQAAADQKRADAVSLNFTAKESSDQQAETVKTVTITKWAIRHVKDISNCPGPDLVRLWDAAATGADPESIVYGASKPYDAPAPP